MSFGTLNISPLRSASETQALTDARVHLNNPKVSASVLKGKITNVLKHCELLHRSLNDLPDQTQVDILDGKDDIKEQLQADFSYNTDEQKIALRTILDQLITYAEYLIGEIEDKESQNSNFLKINEGGRLFSPKTQIVSPLTPSQGYNSRKQPISGTKSRETARISGLIQSAAMILLVTGAGGYALIQKSAEIGKEGADISSPEVGSSIEDTLAKLGACFDDNLGKGGNPDVGTNYIGTYNDIIAACIPSDSKAEIIRYGVTHSEQAIRDIAAILKNNPLTREILKKDIGYLRDSDVVRKMRDARNNINYGQLCGDLPDLKSCDNPYGFIHKSNPYLTTYNLLGLYDRSGLETFGVSLDKFLDILDRVI